MFTAQTKSLIGLSAVSLFAACSSPSPHVALDPPPDPIADAGADAGVDAGLPPVTCGADVVVTGPLFVDVTEQWNLGPPHDDAGVPDASYAGLRVNGNRIVAADLDGDGYPDLVIHAITSNAEERVDGGAKIVWQLMNRPRPGGGRMFVDATANGFFQLEDGGTDYYRSAQLAVFADVDNDGDLDGFSGTYADPTHVATDPGDRSEVMLNDGTGHFTLAPPTVAHDAAPWPLTSATFTDVDRDGRIDLFTGYWYQYYGQTYQGMQAQLYLGQGGGSFALGTDPAGLTTTIDGFFDGTNHRPAYGVTSCDLDGDGAPELMVTAYGRQFNMLYQNDGTAHFTEVGQQSNFAADGNLDYSDNQFFACFCTVHPTAVDCAGVAPPLISCGTPADALWADGIDNQPWRLGGNNFTTLCADMDDDGDLDLYNADIKHWHIGQSADPSQLLVNNSTPGNLNFTRVPNSMSGLLVPHPTQDWNEGGLMAAAGDLDLDGRQDLVVAFSDYPDNFGLVYHQLADHTYEEVSAQWNIVHACTSGQVVADFDLDGDLDVVVGSGTARDCGLIWKTNEVRFYENRASDGHWLELSLEGDGTHANRSAIGAMVTVKVNGRQMTRELSGGYGHFGQQNDLMLHFGLSGCPAVDEVTVRWPDLAGTTQTFKHLDGDARWKLKMGDAAPHRL
jgi:hypothetical protein